MLMHLSSSNFITLVHNATSLILRDFVINLSSPTVNFDRPERGSQVMTGCKL